MSTELVKEPNLGMSGFTTTTWEDHEDQLVHSPITSGQSSPSIQLRAFDQHLDSAQGRMARELADTENACRELLRYFGLDVTDDELSKTVTSTLTHLSSFLIQVGQAWNQLDEHGA